MGGERSLSVSCVSIGNPHAVLEVEDVAAADVATLGPAIETHPAFPARTNVQFVESRLPNTLHVRSWERGVGETEACASGAAAAAIVALETGVLDPRPEHRSDEPGLPEVASSRERDHRERPVRTIHVYLPGGRLDVAWAGGSESVFVEGPANRVFSGAWVEGMTESVAPTTSGG